MDCKFADTKSVLKLLAIITAAAALITGAVVLITKLVKKKNGEKCYIECDCDDTDSLEENSDESEEVAENLSDDTRDE